MHRTTARAAGAFPRTLLAVLASVVALAPRPADAEGSRQWNADAGTRMHLEYNNAGLQTSGVAIPRRTPVWVYVRAGERLYLGSSANGVAGTGAGAATGAITVTRRDGSTFTCPTTNPTGTNNSVGVIHTRDQERNGPRAAAFTTGSADPGSNTFYNPCITPVASSGEEGVWAVEFVSPAPGGGGNPTPALADADWNGANDDTPQDLATFTVAAWDVSVRNASNSGFIAGRVYFNYIAINVGTNSPTGGGVNSDLLVQTRDGYRYRTDFQGFDPFGAILYVNNRGFTSGTNGTGTPTYASRALPTTNFYLPTQADNALNTTHKIFLNPPDTLMPTSASAATLSYAHANSGWLRPTAAIAPVVDRITLRGVEGSPEAGGTVPIGRAPLGATVGFRTNITGALSIGIDINNDADTSDPIDRVLSATSPGPATPTGFVTVETAWDGRDGQGNPLAPGPVSISVRSVNGLGEFHFPILDAENNSGGFRFDRVASNWTTVEDDRMFWDDAAFSGGTSSPNTGNGTAGPAHSWSSNFGNDRGIDTWTFVRASSTQAFTLAVREADLQVTAHALTAPATPVALGAALSYSLTVTNAGPQAVNGARVRVDVPTEVTALGAPSCVAAGGAVCQSQVFNGNTLEASIDLPVGATATYTYAGTLSARPPSGRLTSVAAIQRSADFTDPTATNPDAAAPIATVQGVRDECNATVAGSGNGTAPTCNNLRVAQSPVLDIDVSPSLANLPTQFTQGSPYSGSFTCTNAGPNDATNVTCAVTGLPPGLTASCTPAPPATLVAGASITCTVSGTPSATGNFPVSVTTSADNDGNPDNNVASTSLIGATTSGLAFGCPANGDAYQVRASGTDSLLLRFPGAAFAGTGSTSAAVVNGSLTPNLNALGLRETDGFLYALLAGTAQPTMYRVGQSGAALIGTIVTVAGQTPALGTGFVPTGGVFDTAGRYYFLGQSGGNTAPNALYRVDDFSTDVDGATAGVQLGVAQVYPFVAGSGTTLPVLNIGDIAFGPDGNLYGATQGVVVQLRLSGSSVVVTSRALASSVGAVGSAFFNGGGSFFVYANGTEQVSEILFDFGAAFDTQPTPVPVVARGTVTATGASGFTSASDGASCARFTPSDAVAAITLPAVLAPGVATSGTITCTNNGPSAAQAMTCSASTTTPGVTLSVGACTPPSPATVRALAGENTITCPITVTAAGPNGGGDSQPTIVATTGETSAVGESNTGNNTATTSSLVLDAIDDVAPTSVSSASGGVAIADVRANDGRGSTPPTSANAVLSPVSTSNAGVTLDPATGAINVAPNTPPGTYTVVYRLCDAVLTTVCDTATATVTVGAVIDAFDDAPTALTAVAGGTTTSVVGNDSANGQSVVIGGGGANATLTPGPAPTPTAGAITMNADGTISVAAGTTPGTYAYPYTLCLLAPNSAICDTATAIVTVGASIDAVNDAPAAITTTGGTTPSVIGNDTVNGQALVLSGAGTNATLAPGVAPSPVAGSITMNADGTITVAANTTPGTYTYPYTVCVDPALTPAVCDTATATVVVNATSGMLACSLRPYGSFSNGAPFTLRAIDPTTGASSPLVPPSVNLEGSGNSLGITPDGLRAYYVVSQGANIGQLRYLDVMANTDVDAGVNLGGSRGRMGIAPSGNVGYAGVSGTGELQRFTTPAAGASTVTNLTVVNSPGTPADLLFTNRPGGDLAVAGDGTLYLLTRRGGAGANQNESVLYRAVVAGNTATVSLLGVITPAAGAANANFTALDNNGIAFIGSRVYTAGVRAGLYELYLVDLATLTATFVYTGTVAEQQPIDLASCSYPTLAPSVAATKTATVVPPATDVLPGVQLEYAITVRNVGDVSASNVRLADPIPAGTTYVAGSTTLNGAAVADVGGAFPFASAAAINSPGQPAGVLAVDATPAAIDREAVVRFRVSIDARTTTVSNQGTVSFTEGGPVLTDDPSIGGPADPTVTRVGATIDAVDDGPVRIGAGGGSLPTVLANDLVNGRPIELTGASPNATLTPGTAPTPAAGAITMNADGTITVAPGTTPGTYTFPYTICALPATTPPTCDTAIATVIVAAPLVIDAVDDAPSSVGPGGGDTASVVLNDTANGQPVVLVGPGANATLTPGAAPSPTAGAITMNADGTITVAPGTTPGTYQYPYTICLPAPDATVCDTAFASVVVSGTTAVISAVADGPDAVSPSGGTVPSVLDNDRVNGVAVVIAGPSANATLQPGAAPRPAAGAIAMNPDGTITVAPGTTPGTYIYPYTICVLPATTPATCSTTTATIVVAAPTIVAINDGPTPVVGSGGTVPSVVGNDRVNGQPILLSGAGANARLTPGTAPTPVAGSITMNPDGSITVAAGTTPGTYTYPYTICVVPATTPPTCSSAIATIVVSAGPVIDAVDDGPTTLPGSGGVTPSVIGNDRANGAPVVLTGPTPNAVLTPGTPPRPAAGAITMNPDGTITVAPGTTPGTYLVPYTLCLVAPNAAVCDTAVATVVVAATPVIDAINDAGFTARSSGGRTPSVIGNDTANGAPAVIGVNVTLSPGAAPRPASGAITMNPDGTISIAPGTTPGTYTYPYTICLNPPTTPPTCDTATAVIVVTAGIVAVNDAPPPAPRGGGTLPSISDNDSVDGRPLVLLGLGANAGLLPVVVPTTPSGGFVVNPDGTIVVLPGTTPGSYTIPYTVCIVPATTPATCSSATITIVVEGLPPGALVLSKTSDVRDASVGSLVTYTLTVSNTDRAPVMAAEVVDAPPAGFDFVTGSASIDDADGVVGAAGSRPIRFTGVDVPANGTVRIRYRLRVGAAVPAGVHTNTAQAFFAGQPASGTAQASVITGANADPLFEQSRIWGKVFDDRDGDGWQDEGEVGLPGVRLALVEGLVAETDRHGRYHVEGLVLSNLERGQNVIVKLDVATLPAGAEPTTENPLVRRVTAGLPTRFDFGVRLPAAPVARREVELELGTVIFAPGSTEVREAYRPVVQRLVDAIVEHRGGDIVLSAEDAPGELELRRAEAVREAMLSAVDPTLRDAVRVRIDVVDVGTALALDGGLRLGTVLFDTDRTAIRPEFRPLVAAVAKRIAEATEPLTVTLTGYADGRAPDDYNLDLSRRRATAVADALRAELPPEARDALRVVVDGGEGSP